MRNAISSTPKNALPEIGLQAILAEKETYSDSFTQYAEQLFEEFDFDQAVVKANELGQEASKDILLRHHASEIRRQALLYVFETQSKTYKTGNDLSQFCETQKIQKPEVAATELQ